MQAAENQFTETAGAEQAALDEILPAVYRLSAHAKLILIRILADELANENQDLLHIPPGTYEFFTPYEMEGIANDIVERYNKMPSPQIPSDAT